MVPSLAADVSGKLDTRLRQPDKATDMYMQVLLGRNSIGRAKYGLTFQG
jgi:hypothetical protein